MPKSVRNFWVETAVDGLVPQSGTGPKSRTGGFETKIFMRNKGEVNLACRIIGEADEQGRLRLRICPNQDIPVQIVGEQTFLVAER